MLLPVDAIEPTLQALIDRLIPKDDWPSASENGVLGYLRQRCMTAKAEWHEWLRSGLKALDQAAEHRFQWSFRDLTAPQQDELLGDVEAGRTPEPIAKFLQRMVVLVAQGYYGSPGEGNPKAASWEMMGYRPGPLAVDGAAVPEAEPRITRFDQIRKGYDAVIVGSGAGGSVAAMVLARAGLRVLVIERGEWLGFDQVGQNHLKNHRLSVCGHNTGPSGEGHPRTILTDSGQERVTLPHENDYHNNAMTLGGGTRVYGAQAWRFHPDDFVMATRYGIPEGSTLQDWPIRYAELEPYYVRAEWEIGVSGDGEVDAHPSWRSRAYPMPPLSETLETSVLARAARSLGWQTGPVPLLINSIDRDGRPGCGRCGQCVGFACPTNSKNGGHNTALLRALATGRVDLVTGVMAERIDSANHRVTGVRVVTREGNVVKHKQILAGHVIVACGAIESARLLLNSATVEDPHGLGNGSDMVGKNLQGHSYAGAYGIFDEVIQDGLGPGPSIATRTFSHGNPGIIGGGMLANEFIRLPMVHWYRAMPPDVPRWGLRGKTAMREGYLRTAQIQGPAQEIPVDTARVRVSTKVRDCYGVPVAQLSGRVHPESVRAAEFLSEQALTWLARAGARQVWKSRAGRGLSAGQHQAGTLRMGDDPATSVTDRYGRVHGYRNLFVVDGSVHVTNGGVNPVLTILALAFRTSEHLVKHG